MGANTLNLRPYMGHRSVRPVTNCAMNSGGCPAGFGFAFATAPVGLSKMSPLRTLGCLKAAAVNRQVPVAMVRMTKAHMQSRTGPAKHFGATFVGLANTTTGTISQRMTATSYRTRHKVIIATTATRPSPASAYFIAGTTRTASLRMVSGLKPPLPFFSLGRSFMVRSAGPVEETWHFKDFPPLFFLSVPIRLR